MAAKSRKKKKNTFLLRLVLKFLMYNFTKVTFYFLLVYEPAKLLIWHEMNNTDKTLLFLPRMQGEHFTYSYPVTPFERKLSANSLTVSVQNILSEKNRTFV